MSQKVIYSEFTKKYTFSQLVFELVTSGKSKIMAMSMRREFLQVRIKMIQYIFSGQLNTKSTYFCAEIGKKHHVNYVTMLTKILTCYQ